MPESTDGLSKRSIVGLLIGLAVAIPNLFLAPLHGAAQDLVVWFALPGMIASMILSGNVHAFPMWLAAIANVVFYFLLVRFICWIIDHFNRKRVAG